ncbi:hypothetical protein OWV82_025151, partial [Melia azedarach]
ATSSAISTLSRRKLQPKGQVAVQVKNVSGPLHIEELALAPRQFSVPCEVPRTSLSPSCILSFPSLASSQHVWLVSPCYLLEVSHLLFQQDVTTQLFRSPQSPWS